MPTYRGRFAPSPTGPLHFGSLLAAVASYAEARSRKGEWLVRIEDVDRPRTVPGAADAILNALEFHGFTWDGPVVYQSEREAHYQAAFDALSRNGCVYPCGCSRQDLPGDGVYPGTCRQGLAGKAARSWRLRVFGGVDFEDRLLGIQRQNLESECGDFVLRRADGLWAYQLAVVVDDAAQQVTDVVRGADLLDSTARQIFLGRLLGYPQPTYLHIPVVVDQHGFKLSKQTGAPPLDAQNPSTALTRAANVLGHATPQELHGAPPAEFWDWLLSAWDATRIPALAEVRES